MHVPLSLYRLLIEVNHALIANFSRRKYAFNSIRENKVLAKISEITVTVVERRRHCNSDMLLKIKKGIIRIIDLNSGKVSDYRCVSDCRSRGHESDPGPVPSFRGD